MKIEITDQDVQSAAARASHSAMGILISGFGDCDNPRDNRSIRYERLSKFLSLCKGCFLKELEEQEHKAQRLAFGAEQETPDIFTFSGHKKKHHRKRYDGYGFQKITINNL